jgi:hypothetical protein
MRTILSFIILFTVLLSSCNQQKNRILVFSKTKGYRHESIEAGKEAISKCFHR